MLVQIIGFIGFLFLGLGNLQKDRKKIITFQTISSIFFSVHYFLLNAITASMLNIIGITRGFTFYNKNKTKKYYVFLFIYIIFYIIIGIITYDNIFSLLPIFAYTLFTISIFNEKEKNIKIINIFVSLTWVIYDFIYKSYAGFISDIVMIITTITGLFILNKDTEVLKK